GSRRDTPLLDFVNRVPGDQVSGVRPASSGWANGRGGRRRLKAAVESGGGGGPLAGGGQRETCQGVAAARERAEAAGKGADRGSMAHKQIYYSDKYDDEEFEYRHVMLPKDIAKLVPKTHLMSESEWRNLGVQQSQGWVHYMIHEPEPHILLFRRPLPKKPEK
uniref:Cyclin-dependent kinases regulatory subunit n=1 Tax=Gopherus agassizii TaxID=38772 RepID=A0A452HDR0_9SAUR